MIHSCRLVETTTPCISVKELDIIMSGSSKNRGRDFLSLFFYARPALARFLPARGEILLYHASIQIVKQNLKKILHKNLSQNLVILLLTLTL